MTPAIKTLGNHRAEVDIVGDEITMCRGHIAISRQFIPALQSGGIRTAWDGLWG